MSPGRIIHFLCFSIIIILAFISYFFIPALWTGQVTVFSTIGGFVTFYGVIFAIIETWRARSASEMASHAADAANKKTTAMFNIKSISECQSCIRDTLIDVDKDGWASTATLSRIIELYTAEFYEEYNDPNSDQRINIASLQSHASTASGPLKKAALSRLKRTLTQMLADLTAAASTKISETSK
ncbi:hypothetical protein [Acetobacter sp. AAB5]|uniref:hypothetical protein n=1 Tax=Acetobacter sp. AAB5 TaxID=3418370 RepID=UPI003CEB7B39